MPKIGDMFPSKWIRAQDIMDMDLSEINLTIDNSLQEEIGPERESKLVLYFRERIGKHEKALILNKTNIASIIKMYGDNTDDWEGQQITLYVTETTFKGEPCEAIRVRSKVSKGKAKSERSETVKVKPVNEEEHDSDEPPF